MGKKVLEKMKVTKKDFSVRTMLYVLNKKYGVPVSEELVSACELDAYKHKIGLHCSLIDPNIITEDIKKSTDWHICDSCYNYTREYYELPDTRICCLECRSCIINNEKDYKLLYYMIIDNLNKYFGIEFKSLPRVYVSNSKKIAEVFSYKFDRNKIERSSPDYKHYIGAVKKKDGVNTVWLEDCRHLLPTLAIICHELMHVWQFETWDSNETIRQSIKYERGMLSEGMACWLPVQFLLYIAGDNEKIFTDLCNRYIKPANNIFNIIKKKLENGVSGKYKQNDHYGRGFANFYHQYGFNDKYNIGINEFIKNLGITTLAKDDTPFKNDLPLDLPVFWTKEKWEARFEK